MGCRGSHQHIGKKSVFFAKICAYAVLTLMSQEPSFGPNFGSPLFWTNYFNRTHVIEITIFKQLPHPRNCTKGFARVIESTGNIPRDGKDLPFPDKETRPEEMKLSAWENAQDLMVPMLCHYFPTSQHILPKDVASYPISPLCKTS